jgi:hypothetical protein
MEQKQKIKPIFLSKGLIRPQIRIWIQKDCSDQGPNPTRLKSSGSSTLLLEILEMHLMPWILPC